MEANKNALGFDCLNSMKLKQLYLICYGLNLIKILRSDIWKIYSTKK